MCHVATISSTEKKPGRRMKGEEVAIMCLDPKGTNTVGRSSKQGTEIGTCLKWGKGKS